MSIATKKRPSVGHKKVKGNHHRHSKTYLKTYWPYIPIILIVAIGVATNHYWPLPAVTSQPHLTAFTYYNVLESSVGVIALTFFLLRHAFAWHKVWVKGEAFVAHHPLLDIALMAIATLSLVLSKHQVII